MKKALLLFAALLVAGFCEKSSGEKPKPLSDDDLERLLKVAADFDSLQERKLMLYQVNKSKPYSGWTKEMYDSGQVQMLVQVKDGKPDGLVTMWHENGQKQTEETWEDGEELSAKYWNSKGEEVETEEESEK